MPPTRVGGGHVIAPFKSEVSDYWLGEECQWDIATKEAVAIDKVLNSFAEQFRNARVDAQVEGARNLMVL